MIKTACKPRRVFITADDFGMNHESNLAIDYAMRNGLVTQASLIVNSPLTDEAVNMAKVGGYADKLNLHLNLTVFSPISHPISNVSKYCSKEGFHFVRHQGIKRLFFPFYVSEIREEFDAQIRKYLSYGLELTHIDSHHYVHLNISSILALFILKKKYNIKSVRSYTRAISRFGRKRPIYETLYYKFTNILFRIMFPKMVFYALPASDIAHMEVNNLPTDVELYTHPCISSARGGQNIDKYSSLNEEHDNTLEQTFAEISKLMNYHLLCYNER